MQKNGLFAWQGRNQGDRVQEVPNSLPKGSQETVKWSKPGSHRQSTKSQGKIKVEIQNQIKSTGQKGSGTDKWQANSD